MAFVRKDQAEVHVVRSGESIKSLATRAGMTWQELAKYNWGTDEPEQLNRYLFSVTGCREKTKDGRNYRFSDDDVNRGTHELNGKVFIPQRFEREGLALNAEHEIRIRVPSADELSSLRIVTDLRVEEIAEDDDTFTLTSTVGGRAYHARLSTQSDHVNVAGYIDLVFDGLDMEGRYTLTVRMRSGETVKLFEDVPYRRLARVSPELEPVSEEPR